MNFFRRNIDLVLLSLIIASFVFVASHRLGTIPVPDSDESMTLQVPYEMLNRGQLSLPMFHILGGNIENSWHSFTPVFFAIFAGFLKIFGWGVEQARAFNLITAVTLLIMTYLVGRRMFGKWVGLAAVALMFSDTVFLGRSRLARSDFIAASFGLLAFYLFEIAEERNSKWHYVWSGLAAGAAVMCHTNMIYMLAVVFVLMILRRGWRVVKASSLYLFGAGAFAVMAYEIIYDLMDYQNFVIQNSRDTVHFRVFEPMGWVRNILDERIRYFEWYSARNVKFAEASVLLHLFLILAAAGIIYLIVRSVIELKRGRSVSEPRFRLVVATLVIMSVFAIVTQRKIIQYVIHLTPWLALSASVMLKDLAGWFERQRESESNLSRRDFRAAMAIAVLAVAIFGYALVRQNQRFIERVGDPELATFDEIRAAFRSIVPEGVCPASIGSAFVWLAFPEHDRCYFTHMEMRLDQPLNLDGKEYALIVKPKFLPRLKKLTGGAEKYHLIGEIKRSAYGSFYIYYTGSDPRILALAPKRYQFFGRKRGFITDHTASVEPAEMNADETE